MSVGKKSISLGMKQGNPETLAREKCKYCEYLRLVFGRPFGSAEYAK